MTDYTHDAILEQAAALGRDGYGTASNMLYAMAAQCYPANQSQGGWQQKLQADQVRLGLMPDTNPDPTVHNVGDADGPASEDYSVPAEAPSAEEPSA